ncbi:hypothetical protein HED60_00760 [Planctomycetales bacterium ZRK34]|nr:hypothetical protein HED60_00760 [Planctomycetales bacterium ZRK34]
MTGRWRMLKACGAIAVAWLGINTSILPAAEVIPVGLTDVTASSQQRPADNTIDDSGLTTNGSGDVVHDNVSGNMWNTSGSDVGYITFDLGSVQTIDFIQIWNFNEGGGWYERGAKTIDIYTATTGTLASPDVGAKVGTITLDMANGVSDYAGHNFRFGPFAPTTPAAYDGGSITHTSFKLPAARFVMLDVQDTYNTATYEGTGLSEVRFLTVPTVDPLLAYNFTDAAGSSVPNHGTVGSAGNATTSGSASVGAGSQPFANSDYVSVTADGGLLSTADVDAVDSLNDMTLAFWIKPNESTSQNWQDVMGDISVAAPNNATGWNIQMMNGGVLRFRPWNSSNIGEFNSAAGTVVQGEWAHITMVVTGLTEAGTHDVTVTFYKDGDFLNEVTLSVSNIMAGNTAGFKIGNAMWDGELLADYGDVQLFGEALTAEQVQKNYLISLIPTPGALPAGLALMAGVLMRRRRLA